METRLSDTFTFSTSASCSSSGVMAQSVVMKHSIVPILGWIIPDPLAMAPMVTCFPPMVQVTAISVTDGAYKVGSYDSFSGSKTIALKINSCVTKGAGKMSITKDAFPKIGAAQNLPLTYFAKVSGDAPNSKDVQAANVVFTISIVG